MISNRDDESIYIGTLLCNTVGFLRAAYGQGNLKSETRTIAIRHVTIWRWISWPVGSSHSPAVADERKEKRMRLTHRVDLLKAIPRAVHELAFIIYAVD